MRGKKRGKRIRDARGLGESEREDKRMRKGIREELHFKLM